jgi:hypothetical protein
VFVAFILIGLTQKLSQTLIPSPSPDAKGERVRACLACGNGKAERGSLFRERVRKSYLSNIMSSVGRHIERDVPSERLYEGCGVNF